MTRTAAGAERKLSISSCIAKAASTASVHSPQFSAWTAAARTAARTVQLKAEKVIYFVLRFLTTFSTLYNGNDSRILQHRHRHHQPNRGLAPSLATRQDSIRPAPFSSLLLGYINLLCSASAVAALSV